MHTPNLTVDFGALGWFPARNWCTGKQRPRSTDWGRKIRYSRVRYNGLDTFCGMIVANLGASFCGDKLRALGCTRPSYTRNCAHPANENLKWVNPSRFTIPMLSHLSSLLLVLGSSHHEFKKPNSLFGLKWD